MAEVYTRDSNLTRYIGFHKEWRGDNRVRSRTLIRTTEHGTNTPSKSAIAACFAGSKIV